MEDYVLNIFDTWKKDNGQHLQYYSDLYAVAMNKLQQTKDEQKVKEGVEILLRLSSMCEWGVANVNRLGFLKKLYQLHEKVLQALSPYDFESYLLFTEWNRLPKNKFYIPRRTQLKPLVKALQKLADGDLDLLAISLPPGTGKTTLAIFFLTWMAGKYPDEPILTGSHSNSLVRGIYDECLRILDPKGDYLWSVAFPSVQVVNTNAKDLRIDLGKRKRFDTLEFTSVGTGNSGLYRAGSLLYCDDLVSGLEQAMSKERMDKLWQTYTTDFRQRKIGDKTRELHIATRWSLYDPIGRLREMYGKSERAMFIEIPAVDENGSSNFQYLYGVGFSTKFYKEQEKIMDEASWKALYMNEPIEREGVLYGHDELQRYFDLPTSDPDAILAVCDTKDTGKDYCFMPVFYVYGKQHYLVDCVCDNGLPEVVNGKLVSLLNNYKVNICQFESNAAGRLVAEKVQREVWDTGGAAHITTKFTTSNKETKIIVNSAWVKDHCLFLDESVIPPNSDYQKMMNFMYNYSLASRNTHDDVPDGLAQYALFAQTFDEKAVEVIRRPF